METAVARALLGISPGASDKEVEEGCRARVSGVRERFENARDKKTKGSLKDKLDALNDVRSQNKNRDLLSRTRDQKSFEIDSE